MRKLPFLIAVIITFIVTTIQAEENKNLSNQSKINLAAIVPLTGPLAFFGKDYTRAYELALADHPDIAKHINISWEDSAYDSKQAISAFNKLAATNKTDIVLSFGGPMLSALAPLAESKKIPFFATESEKSDCEGRSYCSLFRNEEDEWGEATWKALRKRRYKKIAIVQNQNQFMNTFVQAIIRTKKDGESVEIIIDVPPSTTDFKSEVFRLKNNNFDAVGIYLLPDSQHGFLSAAASLDKKINFFGVEELMVKENSKGFENLIDGALVIAPYAGDDYLKKFEEKYEYSAGMYYASAAYDFFVLLSETVKNNSALRGIDLINAMRFSGTKDGVSGKFSVKKSPDGVFSYSFPIGIYKVTPEKVVVDEVVEF